MASPFFLVWTLSALINKERLRLFFLAFIIQQKPRGLESYLSFFHLSKRHSEPRERKIPHPHQTGTISGSNITPTFQIPVACCIHDKWVIQYDSSSSCHLFHLFFQWRIFWTFGGREQTIIKEHWFSLFFLSGDTLGKQVPLLYACQLIDPRWLINPNQPVILARKTIVLP